MEELFGEPEREIGFSQALEEISEALTVDKIKQLSRLRGKHGLGRKELSQFRREHFGVETPELIEGEKRVVSDFKVGEVNFKTFSGEEEPVDQSVDRIVQALKKVDDQSAEVVCRFLIENGIDYLRGEVLIEAQALLAQMTSFRGESRSLESEAAVLSVLADIENKKDRIELLGSLFFLARGKA